MILISLQHDIVNGYGGDDGDSDNDDDDNVDEDGDNDQDDSDDDDDDGDNQVWRRSLPSGASSHQGWTLPSPLLGLQQLRVIAITFFLQKVSTKVFHQQFSTKKVSTHLSFAHC